VGNKNNGLRLVSKRGTVFKKHPQARLRVYFIKQIQHSRSESTLDFYLPIRAYLGNPWLKSLPFHFEILEKQFDIRYH
jgi:hypothetical protein